MKAKDCLFIAFLFVLSSAFTCFPRAFGNEKELKDGIYTADYNGQLSAKVIVTIKNSKIADIEVIEHSGSVIGENAEKPIITSIKEQQSTDVNVITGATYSSDAIKNAVEKALEQAKK